MSTAADCANHLFLSERRFRELLDEGVIDRQDRGAYDLDIVREQYITHIREVASGRMSAENSDDLTAEKTRLTREQADSLEMKNAAMRAALLPRGDVQAAVTSAFARVKAKLLSLPSKIAPLVFGSNSLAEIKDLLTDAIHEALTELASTRVAGLLASAGGGGDADGGGRLVEDTFTASEADGEPVGGQRKAAKPRG